jgi:MoaA/NifB/PqqE/SkfB family radical SAM enzyme
MSDSYSREFTGNNHDLFRGSVAQVDPARITEALDWLDGKGPFPGPVAVHYDLTLRCSAHCVHCEQWRWPGHRELGIGQLRALFDTFRAWGVRTVTLGGGNPLLHPNLSDALASATDRALAVGIISEGAPLNPALVDSIAVHSSWVRLSLDGPTPEIHDHIRRAPGLFALVTEAVSKLRARLRQLSIGLNCVVQKENVHHFPEMITTAERIGADAVFFKLPHGDDPANRFLLTAEEYQQFRQWVSQASQMDHGVKTNLAELDQILEIVVDPDDAVRGRPIRSYYLREGVRCFVPMFFLVCDSEGNAYPCDYLQADTRSWEGRHADMRATFCAGNILADADRVLARMAELVRNRVHGLPCGGYDECGCCTRFFQLNTALNSIEKSHNKGHADALVSLRDPAQQSRPLGDGPPFL